VPSVYDRIPRTSFDANALLGDDTTLRIGRNTTLVRRSDHIRLRFRDQTIAAYLPAGAIVTYCGDAPTRGVAAHYRALVPPPWRVAFTDRPRLLRRPYRPTLRFIYGRGGYTARPTDDVFVFAQDGGVWEAGYYVTPDSLLATEAEHEGYERPVRTTPLTRPDWVRIERHRSWYRYVDDSAPDAPPIAPEPRRQPQPANPVPNPALAAWRGQLLTTDSQTVTFRRMPSVTTTANTGVLGMSAEDVRIALEEYLRPAVPPPDAWWPIAEAAAAHEAEPEDD
jgi:hypothetical protein